MFLIPTVQVFPNINQFSNSLDTSCVYYNSIQF